MIGYTERQSKYDITGHYIDVNGYDTYYEESGEGMPVVCLAMLGASGSQYHKLLISNADSRHRYISVDLPGRGKTLPDLKTMEPISDADEYLDFIWAFIDALKLDKVMLLGQAMTAYAVMMLAGLHPDRVIGLIILNGGVIPRAAKDPEYLKTLADTSSNFTAYKAEAIPNLCGKDIPAENFNTCIWYGAKYQVQETTVADNRIFVQLASTCQIDGLCMPILLLNGGEDHTISPEIYNKINSLPHCSAVTIPGAGHYLAMEKPEETAEAIRKFLHDYNL